MLNFPKVTYRLVQCEAKRIKNLRNGIGPKLSSSRKVLEAYIADWHKDIADWHKEIEKKYSKKVKATVMIDEIVVIDESQMWLADRSQVGLCQRNWSLSRPSYIFKFTA